MDTEKQQRGINNLLYLYVIGGLGSAFLLITGFIMLIMSFTMNSKYLSLLDSSNIDSMIFGAVLFGFGVLILLIILIVVIWMKCWNYNNDIEDKQEIVMEKSTENEEEVKNAAIEMRNSASRGEACEMKLLAVRPPSHTKRISLV